MTDWEAMISGRWRREQDRARRLKQYAEWMTRDRHRAPPPHPGPPAPETLGVGVVGLGRGRAFVSWFREFPGVEVRAVCDVAPGYARAVAEKLAVPRCYEDLEGMLADPEIDVVVIETPDDRHGEQTLAALQAGKHVMVDIPLATDLETLARIVETAERAGLKVQMGNEVRWWPRNETLKKLLLEERFGRLFYAEGEYLGDFTGHWRHEDEREAAAGIPSWRGSAHLTQPTIGGAGLHALDTLRWLLAGERLTEVHAHSLGRIAESRRTKPDGVAALFRSESGISLRVTACYAIQRPHLNWLSLHGTEGSYEGDRLDETGVGHFFFPAFANLQGMFTLPLRTGRGEAGHLGGEALMIADFLDAIRTDRPPLIDTRESARSTAAVICAELSAVSGEGMRIPEY
jgi:predicted dehydrogenase